VKLVTAIIALGSGLTWGARPTVHVGAARSTPVVVPEFPPITGVKMIESGAESRVSSCCLQCPDFGVLFVEELLQDPSAADVATASFFIGAVVLLR